VNEKLIKADIQKMATAKQVKLRLHAGSWLTEEPESFPNLELEPIGFSRKWIGEEKLGGGWSSKENPLSGDREFLIKKMKAATLDDQEKQDARGLQVTTAQDGMVHVMPKKT